MSRPYDSNSELRAMIMAALPYPPLPVEAKRFDEDGNTLGDAVMVNSHDIISNLLEQACTRGTADAHKSRQQRQQEVLRCFLRDLVKDGIQPADALYRTYCEHTRDHVAAYYPVGHAPELKFTPLAHVSRGDAVHVRTCDWMAAQTRLLELDNGLAAVDWAPRNYADLLEVARGRLVTEA